MSACGAYDPFCPEINKDVRKAAILTQQRQLKIESKIRQPFNIPAQRAAPPTPAPARRAAAPIDTVAKTQRLEKIVRAIRRPFGGGTTIRTVPDVITPAKPARKVVPPTPRTVATPPTRASQSAPKPKAIAKVETGEPMSIHKSILKSLGSAIGARVQQKIAPAIVAPAIGAAGRVLPAIGRVLTGRVATALGVGAAATSLFTGGGEACPAGFHAAKDGSGRCVRNRRMNFGNARAARRSVRRLKGARKLLRDIEKMMPTKTSRRRAPAGHSAHLHHTGG